MSTVEQPIRASKPRRAKGEGSVYQTTVHKGTAQEQRVWRATITINGKKIVGTSPSRTEALARRQALVDKHMGKAVELAQPRLPVVSEDPADNYTLGTLLDEWLLWKSTTTQDEERITVQVAHMYERTIELHIKPALGEVPLASITRRDLDHFLDITLAAKTKADGTPLLGPSPKRTIRNIVMMAFGYAVRHEILTTNPAIELPRFKKVKVHGEDLHRKAWIIRRILEKIEGTEDEAYWVLALTTGVRQGERLGVRWSAFTNLDGRDKTRPTRLEIRQQLIRNPKTGALELTAPKTDAGVRIIPLPPRTAKVLYELKKRQDKERQSPDWVHVPGMEDLAFTIQGRPVSPGRDNKRWHALFARCINPNAGKPGVKITPHLRGHALRALLISELVRVGTDLEVVRVLAGHADSSITRSVYLHLSWHQGTAPMVAATDSLYSSADEKRAKAEAVEQLEEAS